MLNLNQSSIASANNASQFNAGDTLAREAEAVYCKGLDQMRSPFAGIILNDDQAAILDRRAAEWKDLVEKAYNDIIARRASWMPWTVCGPARYNAARNNARADAQAAAERDWSDKMDRFVENTRDMIRNAIPRDQMLAEYRSGKRKDPIAGDDPDALDKLTARLEGMRERHEQKKKANAWWRKHGTMVGCPDVTPDEARKIDAGMNDNSFGRRSQPFTWSLTNENAEIKRIEDRIKTISRQRDAGDEVFTYDGFTIEQNAADGRINILFDSKPEEAAREILKRNGFHWSPRAQMWTRQLTDNARRAVHAYIIPGLLALDMAEAAQ